MTEEQWAHLDTERTLAERAEMVQHQLIARGIVEEHVLSAMRSMPRHFFVPPPLAYRAYEDRPLEIACGQTISQPYMVALMVELLELRGDETVLEVGTGSGYQTAILALLARHVYTVELHSALLETAETRLVELGLANLTTRCGDGSEGWFEHAPYDRIVVAAAAPKVPDLLQKQLTRGGRMVIPVGDPHMQELTLVVRQGERFDRSSHGNCVFVPLHGRGGWDAEDE